MSNLEMKVEALTRCVDPAVFAKAMDDVSRINPYFITSGMNARRSEIDVGRAIRKLLSELGMPPHIKGYRFAVTVIELAVKHPDYLDAITKELYSDVAEEHDTIAPRVERGIRHAIEVAWDRGDLDVQFKYFGNTVSYNRGKPTNSEFLAKCVETVQLQMQEAQNV